ncbi:S8 family peptidase [Sphingobacterium multivorum]|uniref:S8 family peptidase n=1 Tax=Sphingobacterium multivorum TaxID=28454 RepID=UPI0028AE43A3|nr:S8/S53 family peptidase [Sphingobacterium multivorum]
MELLKSDGSEVQTIISKSFKPKPWDLAHAHIDRLTEQKKAPYYVEPNISSKYFDNDKTLISKSDPDGYLTSWPAPPESPDRLLWHLGKDYSQLRMAAEYVNSKIDQPKIKIAIIDTGYHVGHPFLPAFLHQGRSFIKGEEGMPAHDIYSGTAFEQEGHGTATACILAGKAIQTGDTPEHLTGFWGAIPFAEVVPIRICETVALVQTKAFADAVRYAIEEGCEVISMSMAGAPAKCWAEAVNLAYESGVVLVTAAGNNWYEGIKKALPKRVLFPARWSRVIAATGVACDHFPYNMDARVTKKSEGGETMQGNYGPNEAMQSAIAAYTPNVYWATNNDLNTKYRIDGGGTSSATPQVAAAAALWLTLHRDAINAILDRYPNEKWRKVEMVKAALFSGAETSYKFYKTYYGNGILKAVNTLEFLPNEEVTIAKKARVALWGVLDLLGLLLRLKSESQEDIVRKEMFATEVVQELLENENLFRLLDYNDSEKWSQEDQELLKTELLKSERISERLKEYISPGQPNY